jgi:hypothetical protein
MEPDDKTSTEKQNPFWDSVPASGLETTPQAEQLPLASVNQPESQLISTPQAQIVGDLGQQPTSHFSATVSNSAQFGGQINSASAITSGYEMQETKSGWRWGQFAIGFFAPIVVMILLTGISEFSNGDWDNRWDDVYKIEMITMSSDNGTFTHTFGEEVTDNGRFEVNWCYSMGTYEGYQYECSHSYSDADKKIYEIKENEWNGEVVVGEYTQDNHTIWFTTDSHSIDEMDFEFEFYDRALQNELDESGGGGGDMVDTFFCLMPLIGIGAIVISFVRGNKSLGYGLITSISIPLFLGAFFLMLLLMFGF